MENLTLEHYFTIKQVEVLKKRNVNSIKDLLLYFPRKYIDRSKTLEFRNMQSGELVTFIGKVTYSKIQYGKRRFLLVTAEYNNIKIHIHFFRALYIFQNMLKKDSHYAFSGKIHFYKKQISMMHPEIEKFTNDELIHTGKIIPIYKITDMMEKYIKARTIRKVIFQILQKYSIIIRDYLSKEICEKYNLLTLGEAIHFVHFPKNMQDVDKAKSRLAFDELLIFFAITKSAQDSKLRIVKKHNLKIPHKEKNYFNIIYSKLPFSLTNDQKNVVSQLREKTYEPSPFSVLLQGDVGSGKTIVAMLACLEYIEENIQVAILTPTEVLARQHYKTAIDLFHPIPFLQIEFLIGKESTKEKKIKLDGIQRGRVQIVIGTHALFQKGVHFHNLGFIIIDEQHRFGVEQRRKLIQKGVNPDTLVMTATPIPRSLSLTMFADMETLYIKEKPKNRIPIETKIFPESEIARIYNGVKKYVQQGRQTYIIYPHIGEDDEDSNKNNSILDSFFSNNFENDSNSIATLLKDYEKLKNNVFSNYKIGLLHGKMHPLEKETVMENFKNGGIQILISTTVIEVGIDTPNANVIVIRNAERFGLSQLHQLRGRVGRGKHKSFCILVYSNNITEEGKQRLEIITQSEDGFYLSKKDLEMRGTGELFGTRQAGMSEFKIADLRYHEKIALKSKELLYSNPEIFEYIQSVKNWKRELKKGMIQSINKL